MRAWQTEHDDLTHAAEISGETIKVLVSGPVVLEDGYWDALPVLGNGDSEE
jgi:hypothetical protein